MSKLTRRHLLTALAAITAAPGAAMAQSQALLPGIDPAGVQAVGGDYLRQHPLTASALEADLFPHGWTPAALGGLREHATADFRRGKVFTHQGWRLSETEARLMALLSLR
ncbi:hypothetical protein BH11PSE2_BH11PSE2_08380 [soil metagenome]